MIGVKSESDSSVDIPDAVGVLAEDFLQQYRLGTNPDIEAYCSKHPECADRIRDLFPMLLMVENCSVTVNSEPSEPRVPTRASLPERIGDFKIIREIGRGGMGIVYEAEQQSLRRRVALKVLPLSATISHSTIERFRRESRAAARLHHSNIVPVFGVGEDDGLHYYVMQFIHGVGLDQVLLQLAESKRAQLLGNSEAPTESYSSTAIPLNNGKNLSGSEDRLYSHRVAIIGLQLANALHFAHTQGVLHRDVKPANVLLDSDGLIWLTDFGLAHASDDDNLTRSGDIVGTMRYLAPERLQGDGNQQSDVYGLGATLYELLALVPAFPESDRVTLIRQIAHQEPRRLRSIDPNIPRDLETIVLKAIEKETARRYSSAAELAEDLSRFISDRPILARRVIKLEQLWRWCRRNPTIAGLSSAVCLLMLGMCVAWGMVSWVQSDRDRAWEAERIANRSQHAAKFAEEFAMARSHLAGAVGYRHSREPGHKSKCLAEIAAALNYHPPAVTKAELRNVAIAALAQTDLKLGRQWNVWQDDSKSVTFNRELSRFARLNSAGVISIHNSEDLVEISRIVLPTQEFRRVTLSDQGGFLAMLDETGDGSFQVWNVDRSVRVIGPLAGHWECDFDDLQTKILLWQADQAIHIYSLETGAEIQKLPMKATPTTVALSPNGKQVAFVLQDKLSTVQILDLESAQVINELNVDGSVHICSWHPDGSRIACALKLPSNLEIWDLPTKKKTSTMVGHTQQVGAPCFTKSGDFVSTGSWDGTLRIWETETGQEVAVLTDGSTSHEGHEKVVAMRVENGVHASLELDLPSGFTRFASGNSTNASHFTCGNASPDGRWLVAGKIEGLEIWDMMRGSKKASRTGSPTRSLHIDWKDRRLQTVTEDVGFEHWLIEELNGGWNIAPPKLLDDGSARVVHSSATPDGSRCALVTDSDEVRVLTSRGELVRHLAVPDSHRMVNLSPNGKLLASFGWHSPTSCVWEVDSGKLLHTLEGSLTFHSFSPDSKLMITSRAEDYTLRYVDDWKIVRRIERKECVYPSFVAYSPDESLVAMELSWGVLHLLRTDNFKTVAMLESPKLGRATLFEFSGNGNTLFAFHHLTGEIHRWDIDGLRQRLQSMHLDWDDGQQDQPNSDSAHTSGLDHNRDAPASPDWIVFDGTDAKSLDEKEIWRQKITDAEKKFASQPDSPLAANQLAWCLLIGPSELQDVERAIELMSDLQKSTDLDVNSRNTLAAAYYRSGRFSEAVDLLRINIAVQEDIYLAYDLYFLAMCYWKMGDHDKARETFEWSERMLRLKPPIDVESLGELELIRVEAKNLIQ